MSSLKRRWGTILSIFFLFLTILCAQSLQAQSKTKFSVNNLEGWDEAFYDKEFAALYDFDYFWKYDGSWVSDREKESLKNRWAKERKRVKKKIEKIRSDPGAYFQFNLSKVLKKHGYFSKVKNWEKVVKKPFYFLVQERPDRKAEYQEHLAEGFAEKLLKVEQTFREIYASPLGWKKKDGHGMYAVAILATEGDYTNFAKAVHDLSLYFSRAHYAPEIKLAVTYVEYFTSNRGRARAEVPPDDSQPR